MAVTTWFKNIDSVLKTPEIANEDAVPCTSRISTFSLKSYRFKVFKSEQNGY
jgi:hypothetical protein